MNVSIIVGDKQYNATIDIEEGLDIDLLNAGEDVVQAVLVQLAMNAAQEWRESRKRVRATTSN